jgi:lipid II:glycine glycyltransferase (peptidoglycan interpeptide bridge formation enzyme)
MHRQQRKLCLWKKEENHTEEKEKKRHGKQNIKKPERKGVN